MTTLAQLIGIEAGVRKATADRVNEWYHRAQKAGLWEGLHRVYRPDTDGGKIMPDESKELRCRASDALRDVAEQMTRLFDVTYTKELANASPEARADIAIPGGPVLEDVPVTYMLFLLKQLTDIATFVGKIPDYDPGEVWTPDPGSRRWTTGVYKTARTERARKAFEIYGGSEHHPPQFQVYEEEYQVGVWDTRKFSGGISPGERRRLEDRITAVREAVLRAKEEANGCDVSDARIGKKIFDYLGFTTWGAVEQDPR